MKLAMRFYPVVRLLPFVLLASALGLPSAIAQAAAKATKTETFTVQQVAATIQGLIDQPAPRGMSAADLSEYRSQTEWLQSVNQRVKALEAREAGSGMASGRQKAAAPATDLDTLNLQQELEAESRQFQTMSNVSKARHDTAMNVIQNMKG